MKLDPSLDPIKPTEEYLEGLKDPEAVLVASRTAYFKDDTTRLCMTCGVQVWLRPYNKDATRIVCLDCIYKEIKAND